MSFKIEAIHAFVSTDNENGDEGIVGFVDKNGMWVPMIAADETRLRALTPIAQMIADETGSTMKLIRLSGERTELDLITPAAKPEPADAPTE